MFPINWYIKKKIFFFLLKEELLDCHDKTIRSLSFSPDGEFLASASFDTFIGLWKFNGEKYEE